MAEHVCDRCHIRRADCERWYDWLLCEMCVEEGDTVIYAFLEACSVPEIAGRDISAEQAAALFALLDRGGTRPQVRAHIRQATGRGIGNNAIRT